VIMKRRFSSSGALAALSAAFLFGASTPISKLLLDVVEPWLLAGLLYLGSGIGLMLYRVLTKAPRVTMPFREMLWFAGAIVSGGIVAPVLLLFGLTEMPASGASLLLNAESVFTILLAWLVFNENVDRRIAVGMLAIIAGAVVLSWQREADFAGLWPTLALLGACLAWGMDNNFTRKVSLVDATWIASVKGLVAGAANLALALRLGAVLPSVPTMAGAMLIGFFAYGVSIALFVVALRLLGAARTGAYFAVAPFVGAVIALAFGEPVTLPLAEGGVLMAMGVWLQLTEQHRHEHTHPALEHEHEHIHDEHHQHGHGIPIEQGTEHLHRHRHEELTHTHDHFPDTHHQHKHEQ